MSLTISVRPDWIPGPTATIRVQWPEAQSTSPLTLTRTHQDGSVHPVLTLPNPQMLGSWVGEDRHLPFNEPVTYQAVLDSGGVSSAPVVMPSETPWLIAPSGLAAPIDMLVGPVPSIERKTRTARFEPLYRSLPTVKTLGPLTSRAGQLSMLSDTPEAHEALLDVIDAGEGVVLLNTGRTGGLRWLWLALDGVTESIPGGRAGNALRQIDSAFTECTEPDADADPRLTYAQAEPLALTYAQAEAIWGTYADSELDVRL